MRDTTIDLAKGLAIIFVVAGHLLQYNTTAGISGTCFNWIYSFHMPFFFLLSGYVAAFSRDRIQYPKYVIHKAKQLLIPFAIWSFIVNPWLITGLNIKSCFLAVINTLLCPDLGTWFLLTLFFIQIYYLLFVILADYLRKKINNILAEALSFMFILGGMIAISKAIFYLPLLHVPSELLRNTTFFYINVGYMLMFILGYAFNRYFRSILYHPFALILSSIVFFSMLNMIHFVDGLGLLKLFFSCFASVMLLNLVKLLSYAENSFIKRMLIMFGPRTLQVYVTHYILIRIIEPSYLGTFVNNISKIWLLIISLFFACIITYITVAFTDLLKGNKYLSFLLYGD